MPPRRSTPRPPSDSGLVIDVINLGRRPGSMRHIELTVPAPSRIGLDSEAIVPGAPMAVDVRIEAVSEGVLVTGSVKAPTAGECSRCLDPFESDVEVFLTELFAYPNSITEETTDEDEIHRIVDDEIDLEPVIVDAVGTELPLRPLCSEDCAGLCPECGARIAIVGSGHGHEILDPRWAGLAAKFGVESQNSDGYAEPAPHGDTSTMSGQTVPQTGSILTGSHLDASNPDVSNDYEEK